MGDLYATIYQALGIDWKKEYMSPIGRPDQDRQFAGRQDRFASEGIAGVSTPPPSGSYQSYQSCELEFLLGELL